MERDKLIKIVVAAVIGVAAVVILAMNFLGGGPPKPATDEPVPEVTERSGSGRAAPGGG